MMPELPRLSYSDEPTTVVERAAAAAMRAAELECERNGAAAQHVFVIVHADDVPAGELDCTVAGAGYEDSTDLLAELLGHAERVAAAGGMRLQIHTLGVG